MRTVKFAVLTLYHTAFMPAASADTVTQYYTGKPFTSAEGPYTTSDSISGEVTWDSSLSGTISWPDLINWSFTDGHNVMTNGNMDAASDGDQIELFLDSNGNVENWYISLGVITGQTHTIDAYGFIGDFGLLSSGTDFPVASNSNSAGTWS